MSTSATNPSLLSSHTFGRDHRDPPPLPASIQQGQAALVSQKEGQAPPVLQVQATGLPHDFDHLVRSVGEW